VAGLVRAGAEEVAASTHGRLAHRSTSAALWVLVPQCQTRAIQVIRELSGSGLIMTPTEKDFANTEIAGYLEKFLRGKAVSAVDRVQLFKLAWDLIGEPFGARQLQYEWFYAGDPYFTRQRFFQSPAAAEYKDIVDRLLISRKPS
jgi:anthranilate 3-monooxygenase (FAD)/4-hydroxyphenylacetate 3-monooxygenase